MELINSNNIYIDIGDDQYQLIKNNYIYDFKKYYFKNTIKLVYSNYLLPINLNNQKYFQIKIINLGNYIYLFVFNKLYTIYKKILKVTNNIININYDGNKYLKYQLLQIITILENKLGTDIKLQEDIIFNIRNKLNIIKKDIDHLDNQKILYYKQYLMNTFHI